MEGSRPNSYMWNYISIVGLSNWATSLVWWYFIMCRTEMKTQIACILQVFIYATVPCKEWKSFHTFVNVYFCDILECEIQTTLKSLFTPKNPAPRTQIVTLLHKLLVCYTLHRTIGLSLVLCCFLCMAINVANDVSLQQCHCQLCAPSLLHRQQLLYP